MSPVNFADHAPATGFAVHDGMIHVGGRPLDEIAGQTPCYVYDRASITATVQRLRDALPRGIAIHYAVKANPMPEVVAHCATLVDGLDIASAGELALVSQAGYDLSRVSFAGPGKRETELAAALEAGITVNLESERELDVLCRLGGDSQKRPRVAVRVNPPFQLRSSGMRMGGGAQQFGIDAEAVPALLQRIGSLEVDFEGFHIFTGSQNLSADAICEGQRETCRLAIDLAREAPAPVRLLNLGGGFGIPYFPSEQPLDLAPIAANLAALLPRVSAAMPDATVALELGRFLVGPAGIYVCRVIERKVSRGKVFLVTDGGMHHHLAASGNFGQVLRKNYPVTIANRADSTDLETASVVGPLCTPLDLLADSMRLPRAQPGDLVAVFQSGAYGRTASPLGFLSHPAPGEVLV